MILPILPRTTAMAEHVPTNARITTKTAILVVLVGLIDFDTVLVSKHLCWHHSFHQELQAKLWADSNESREYLSSACCAVGMSDITNKKRKEKTATALNRV